MASRVIGNPMDWDSRTHAAYPVLPSLSSVNQLCGALEDNELVRKHPSSEYLDTLRGLRKYDLRDLWKQYYTSTPFPMSETTNDKIACRLVKHLLWGRSAGLEFDDNKCVKPYRDLSPFIASVDQFPDAYIFDRESELPLCSFEVHSGRRYDFSVKKTIIGVVTHLRLLQHKADVDSCIGFTFPKADEKSVVTQVEVTWNELHFRYRLQPLEVAQVKQALVDAVSSNSAFLSKIDRQKVGIGAHSSYLMRLTDSELQQLHKFGEGKVQVRSHSAIIIAGEGKIYKYCDSKKLMAKMLTVQSMPKQILLPETFMEVHELTFSVYPILSHPLTRGEAYKCLGCLLESVAYAIVELHDKLKVAHLDIRLENICFKESDGSIIAVLIDLD